MFWKYSLQGDCLPSCNFFHNRGFIKELRISIPWTRLQSRPIEIKFKTVEIIITPITHTGSDRSRPSWLYPRTRCGIIEPEALCFIARKVFNPSRIPRCMLPLIGKLQLTEPSLRWVNFSTPTTPLSKHLLHVEKKTLLYYGKIHLLHEAEPTWERSKMDSGPWITNRVRSIALDEVDGQPY